MADFKLLPLGISDFRRSRIENSYYLDKTGRIPNLEQVSKHPTENRGRFQVTRLGYAGGGRGALLSSGTRLHLLINQFRGLRLDECAVA